MHNLIWIYHTKMSFATYATTYHQSEQIFYSLLLHSVCKTAIADDFICKTKFDLWCENSEHINNFELEIFFVLEDETLYSFIALLEKAIKEFLNKAVLFNDFFDDEDAHLEVDFDGEKVKYCYLAEDGLTFSSLYNKYKSLKEAFEAQIPVCIVSMKQKTKL